MRRERILMFVACLGLLSNAYGTMWHDGFDNGIVDMSNYQINLGTGGVCTVTEDDGADPANALGYAKLFTNSPGGSYILNAVKVELGDTVRTKMTQASAWNVSSASVIGLSYDINASRSLDTSVAAFFMQQKRDSVLAYRHVGTVEESGTISGVGDPYGQTWIYEFVLGLDNGNGTFDVVLSVYDSLGVKMGSSYTFTTSTPTGDIYWFAGDNRTEDYIHELSIVPEPATIALLSIGTFVLTLKRKK